jgi:uncharacterized membrane protein
MPRPTRKLPKKPIWRLVTRLWGLGPPGKRGRALTTWNQVYDPMGSMVVSTLVAALPVAVMLVALAILRVAAHWAAISALVVAGLCATLAFGIPAGMAVRAAGLGMLSGLFPIGIIFLYRLTVANGIICYLSCWVRASHTGTPAVAWEGSPMRKLAMLATVAGVVLAGPVIFTGSAKAETYQVCNATANELNASIAFSMADQRGYIWKGWWILKPHGGCANVFSGALPIKGIFLHYDAPGIVGTGDTLFCVLPRAGELPNSNKLNEKDCAAHGGQTKNFEMHVIDASTFTTTIRDASRLTGAPSRPPQAPPGLANDVHNCPADAPCFQEAYQAGNRIIFKFNGVTGWDLYNVRFGDGEQFENKSGTFILNNVKPGNTYTISVQGCHTHLLGHSDCSSWVPQSVATR